MKIVLVGATGTIGTKVFQNLSERHEVIPVSLRSTEIRADITSKESIIEMFRQVGPFDALISATGNGEFAPLDEITEEQFYTGIRSKMMGQINLALLAQKYINENGSITLTSGILADDPIRGGVSLSVVNSAINAFAMAAAVELKRGIRINAISPGIVENSVSAIGHFFPGHNPVPMDRVVNAYLKSVEGVVTGQVIRVV
ncbi:MAG TPA: short chain dehydrogenase [Sphingobacteriaceae bacterium]